MTIGVGAAAMLTAEGIAEIAYETIRAYNNVIGNPWTDPPWEGIEIWYRASIIDGVKGILSGLDPRQSHNRWVAFFVGLGWKPGEAKDPVKKTHPNLIAYDALPPEQQLKDVLFREQVLMLARVNAFAGS